MRHAPPARVTFALAACLALAACSVKDPLYCDGTTPCSDPARPFCDIDGTYPASDGIKRTCIPYPWDASPDPDAGPACTPGEWTLDIIDDRLVLAWPTLVVDAGTVHVAYGIGDPGVLHYARGRAGSWQVIETPDAGGLYPQMAIDSSAKLHLVHGGWSGGLRYLHKNVTDDEFEYELVANPLACDIGFALDSSEEPVTCFHDCDSGGAAKCHEHTSDGWQTFEPPRPETTTGIAMAIDASNTLHFVADGVIYFSRRAGGWGTEETVASTTAIYPAIAVDSDGVPHVVYPYSGIVHAYRAGPNDWTTDDVEHVVDGDAPTIFIDRDDTIHVAYVDTTNSNLKYATRTGGSWSTKTIDATATIPRTPKLFVDADGTPHIVYYDQNDADLRYAYLCP